MTNAKLLQLLQDRPPVELDITSIAQEHTQPNGVIDYYAITASPERLNTAAKQLREHAAAIRKTHSSLLKAAGISQPAI